MNKKLIDDIKDAQAVINTWPDSVRVHHSLPPGEQGFFDLPKAAHCRRPDHNFPNMLYIPPGKGYRHICPGCGHVSVCLGSNVTLKAGKP